MTPDLKAELLDLLDLPAWAHLRARLEKATITEPGPVSAPNFKQELCESLRGLGRNIGKPGYWASVADRLERATLTEPAPTDAELLDALRSELGEGWDTLKEPRYFSCTRRGMNWFLYGSCAALRHPSGIKRTADALRWLASQGVGSDA